MATTTPNFGFDVPTSTDYVKDGALAIETLGDDIDDRFGDITNYPNQIVNRVSGVSRPVPFATQAGTGTLAFAASNNTSVTVTFAASRFTQAPLVFFLAGGTAGAFSTIVLRHNNTTSTSTTIVGNLGGATTGNLIVNFFAVQMTSATGAG
jgi:hypothetical protein